MDTTVARLEKCFLAVFPDLEPYQVRHASPQSVSDWDSMAQITLLTLVGEEFGIPIDFEEFEGVCSFEALLSRVRPQ